METTDLFCKYIHKVNNNGQQIEYNAKDAPEYSNREGVYLSIHTGHEFHNHKKAGLGINNRQNRSCLTKAR